MGRCWAPWSSLRTLQSKQSNLSAVESRTPACFHSSHSKCQQQQLRPFLSLLGKRCGAPVPKAKAKAAELTASPLHWGLGCVCICLIIYSTKSEESCLPDPIIRGGLLQPWDGAAGDPAATLVLLGQKLLGQSRRCNCSSRNSSSSSREKCLSCRCPQGLSRRAVLRKSPKSRLLPLFTFVMFLLLCAVSPFYPRENLFRRLMLEGRYYLG